MSGILELEIENTMDSVSRAAHGIEAFAEEQHLSPRQAFALSMIFEEMATNIVKYSYDDDRRHVFFAELKNDGEGLLLALRDDGHEFDPLSAPPPKEAVDLEEAEIGGQGIALVRRMGSSLSYQRKDSWNIFSCRIPG